MSKAKVTLTQQKIKQELLRRGYVQKKTTQSEYLKFQSDWPYFSNDARLRDPHTLWIGRRGEIRLGHRLPTSMNLSHRLYYPTGIDLRRAAKANYQQEATE